MKVKNQYQRRKLKAQIRTLTPDQKSELCIKLYKDGTTIKLLAALFECECKYVVELLEKYDIKRCTQCGRILSRSMFHKASERTDGLMSQCKDCKHDYRKEYYENNKKECLAKSLQWKQKNADRVYELKCIRKKENPAYKLNSCIANLIYIYLKRRNLSKNHRHWEDLVGYTLQELKEHLESLFQPGMTWDNYGEWHIDHIIPQSSFHFESYDDPEFKKCWSLTNLQPLWAKDNLKKSNKLV